MAEHLRFSALSSDGHTVYKIQAYATAAGVRFACSCEAGQKDTLCKHRTSLAEGDERLLVKADPVAAAALRSLLAPTPIPQAIARLRANEATFEQLRPEIAAQKKEISAYMRG